MGVGEAHGGAQLITSVFGANSVNVTDYGATGDGSTDDGPFFQAAIDALPFYGGVVVVPTPSVNYKIDTQVTTTGTKRNLTFIGWTGKMSSVAPGPTNLGGTPILCSVDSDYAFVFGDTADNHDGPTILGLSFIGDSAATNPSGVKTFNMNGWSMYNCVFRDLVIGVEIDHTASTRDNSWWVIQDCEFRDNTTGGVLVTSSFGGRIEGGKFIDNTTYHIKLNTELAVRHCVVYGAMFDNSVNAIVLGGGDNFITHCKFEGSSSAPINVKNGANAFSGSQNIITHNGFYASAATAPILFDSGSDNNIYGFNMEATMGTVVDNGANNKCVGLPQGTNTPDTITSSSVAISLFTDTTYVDSSTGFTATIADGYEGQRKVMIHTAGTNAATIGANLDITSISTNLTGESYELLFTGATWSVISTAGNGTTLGASIVA